MAAFQSKENARAEKQGKLESMYGKSNLDIMPDYSNYDLWDEYMGGLWQGLIECSGIQPDSTIIEVAPGATAKISCALSRIHFKGRLYIIEPHPGVSEIIFKKSRKLLPEAEVIMVRETFNQVRIQDRVDAVLANHVLDDFISAYAATDRRDILFQDISREEKEVLDILKATWQQLIENTGLLSSIKQKIKGDWQNFINFHSPNTLILSQYASSYFEKHDLAVINIHARDLFEQICAELKHSKPAEEVQQVLNTQENYKNTWIGEELLNAGNWVINEKRH